MYIHSYQIHNVLNVYRKQLSQGTPPKGADGTAKAPPHDDRINISNEGQRQFLFDKISTEIVERITQFGPETQFEGVLADQMAGADGNPAKTSTQQEEDRVRQESAFTYTIIDEYNKKLTNTLSVRPFGLPTEAAESMGAEEREGDTNT